MTATVVGPVTVDGVATALGLGPHEHVALVGGGGKSTLLHALGSQLAGTRILTTTTKMGSDQDRGRPVLLAPDDATVAAVAGVAVVWRSVEGPKAHGVEATSCDRWFGLVDHVVVEADGSKHLPFKAPGNLEPVVPATATMVVSVVGADALGRVILDACHRPLRVAALAGCSPSVRLTPEGAARVLLHPHGYRAATPAGARFAVAVTKVDDLVSPQVEALLAALVARAADEEIDVTVVTVAHTGR